MTYVNASTPCAATPLVCGARRITVSSLARASDVPQWREAVGSRRPSRHAHHRRAPYDNGSEEALAEALAGVDFGRCMHAPVPELKAEKQRHKAEEKRRKAHAVASPFGYAAFPR